MVEQDIFFMNLALYEAKKALKLKEIPVGAVIVCKDRVIARGFNLKEKLKNPLAHAEIIAINRASVNLDRWRLDECVLYVTLEPCPMCAGAIVQARIPRLVYGASDPKAGAVKSLMNITGDRRLNHQVETTGGVLEEECISILKEFFRELRLNIKSQKS